MRATWFLLVFKCLNFQQSMLSSMAVTYIAIPFARYSNSIEICTCTVLGWTIQPYSLSAPLAGLPRKQRPLDRSDTKVVDWYLIDVDPTVFTIWVGFWLWCSTEWLCKIHDLQRVVAIYEYWMAISSNKKKQTKKIPYLGTGDRKICSCPSNGFYNCVCKLEIFS